ncbi:hypothetical protein TNCT_457651 [Trichonephila clavata]|uniref:Uncharacterized protein n=1 Tax=Trichonephila clavata TaxID=2740835 RepID=A0A8X6IAH3_TRICU|nr:hypothetical protein TNCT_457651 [Trichonephila clavata]
MASSNGIRYSRLQASTKKKPYNIIPMPSVSEPFAYSSPSIQRFLLNHHKTLRDLENFFYLLHFDIAILLIMAKDFLFQHLLHHLFPYYYVEYLYIDVDVECIEAFVPKFVLTQNLFDIIAKAMYGLEDFFISIWLKDLKYHYEESIKDAETYILHVMIFCMDKKLIIDDAYEIFVNVCALVTAIGIRTFHTTSKRFYKLTPLILTVFFEKVLKEDFKKRGGWKRLEKYLMCQGYLEYYETYKAALKHAAFTELDKKTMEFSLRRRHVFSPFPNVEMETGNRFIISLTAEVISSADASLLTELRLEAIPSTFDRQEELSLHVEKLSLKNELYQSSEDHDIDIAEVSYHASLGNHILNLKRLVSSNTENSCSGESSHSSAVCLIASLRCLKLKVEHAISLLESLETE